MLEVKQTMKFDRLLYTVAWQFKKSTAIWFQMIKKMFY